MGILFIHLSDLHLETQHRISVDRVDSLCRAVANDAARAFRTYLVLSGDLTWSGKEDEALQAIELIETMKARLSANPRVEVEILVVPGNHDCDFASETAVRRALVDGIIEKGLSATIDADILQQCISIQKNVLEIKDYFETASNRIVQNEVVTLHTYSDGPLPLVIRCVNTAWMSRISDKPGRIVIPPSFLQECDADHRPALNLLILHHPLHWFHPDQMRLLRQHCEEISDIIVEGHEHEAAASQRKELKKPRALYLHGGVYHSPSDKSMSTFNTLFVDDPDDDEAVATFSKYIWSRDHYELDKQDSGSETIHLRPKAGNVDIAMSEELRKQLDDPGAAYTHPRVVHLRHEDIFVYPDLRTLSFNPRRSQPLTSETLSSSEVLQCEEHTPCRLVIIGQQKAGRTALMRQLAKDAFSRGMLPVWLDGSAFSSTKREHVERKLQEAFLSEYESNADHALQQHPNTRKVIFVDNLDRARLSTRYRLLLLDELAAVSEHVVISATDTFQIEEMSKADGTAGKSLQDDFGVYQILEFGNVLRDRLIRKWIYLGQEASIETNEFYRQTDQAKALIDSIIGINLVPSLPFFILTLLQSYEAASPHDLRLSSYGYYYEFLILASMQQLTLKADQVDAYQNYLAELAFQMFQRGSENIDAESLRAFENTYATAYRLYEEVPTLRDNLVRIEILTEASGSMAFRYRYIFYFFVAKYLANNMSEQPVKDMVLKMSRHPHVTVNANVLILLTYLSREPFIVDSILDATTKVFGELRPAQLQDDIAFFNTLTKEIPELVLESIKIEEARERALRAEDGSTVVSPTRTEADNEEKEVSELDLIAKINLAFKLTEILGQIAKSYYGSMKHERKLRIIAEACESVLRTLTAFFDLVQANKEQLVSEVVEILRQHKVVDAGERERIIGFTKSFIFQVSGAVTFGFVKKISRFVGSRTLSPSIREYLDRSGTVAAQLIDKAIKLDYFGEFPFSELATLAHQIEHNTLAYAVLRSLVINHLYMFEVGYRDRQRICQAFAITMADTRKIDFQSKERKTG